VFSSLPKLDEADDRAIRSAIAASRHRAGEIRRARFLSEQITGVKLTRGVIGRSFN